jgi:hypothetical protein
MFTNLGKTAHDQISQKSIQPFLSYMQTGMESEANRHIFAVFSCEHA